MDEESNFFPELKDIETKLGRKVPDSLVRTLVAGKHKETEKSTATHITGCKFWKNSADLKRLESKMQFLKQEMVSSLLLCMVLSRNFLQDACNNVTTLIINVTCHTVKY